MSYGVGFIGAGPVVQAIHLPTLARMPESFRVVHVMDVAPVTADAVAKRVGAAHSSTVEELLADPDVEIVAVCSPSEFHAEHVTAAIDAGKRAVLCEKPFAVSVAQADALAELSARSGIPLLVGAMHLFDSGWHAARDHLRTREAPPALIRSAIMIPPNSRYEDFATQIHERAAIARRPAENPAAVAAKLTGSILGLAIHDLPLIRTVMPRIDWVDVTRLVSPYGYSITFGDSETMVELTAHMHAHWEPEWRLEFWYPDEAVRLDFSPSYVHAGSASGAVRSGLESRVFDRGPANGYEGEWRHMARLCDGEQQNPEELHAQIDDLRYALDLAERVTASVMDGSR